MLEPWSLINLFWRTALPSFPIIHLSISLSLYSLIFLHWKLSKYFSFHAFGTKVGRSIGIMGLQKKTFITVDIPYLACCVCVWPERQWVRHIWLGNRILLPSNISLYRDKLCKRFSFYPDSGWEMRTVVFKMRKNFSM